MVNATAYDDKLDDVMRFVTMNLNQRGVRAEIRNKEDLRTLLKGLNDENNKHSGERGYVSDGFINAIMRKANPERYTQTTIGRRGRKTIIRGVPSTRVVAPTDFKGAVKFRDLQKKGVVLLRSDSPSGLAYSQRLKIKDKTKIVYRDFRTGRFVSSKKIRGE